jgi:endonuclease/exonuclease/phosphatase family metal-dependent hydrolase
VADAGSKIRDVSKAVAVAAGSWAVAGGLAAYAAARLTSADDGRRTEASLVPVLLSFTPQVTKAAPWAALGLRLTGQRKPAATAAVAAGALSLLLQSRKLPKWQPGASGARLRVLTCNMFFGRGDAEVLVDRVRRLEADVLFLQELTADAVTRLKQAGLDELMPYTQIELRGGPRGSGIYSRFPLGEGPALEPIHAAQPTAVVELPDGYRAELVCVHPCPPASEHRGAATRWRGELGSLTPPGDLPRIVAGDFNATLDHAAFRNVLRLGYADAALGAGTSLNPTWGMPGKNPVLTLDHVLVDTDCAVLDSSVHLIPGSDHRAVYAEIQLPELEPKSDSPQGSAE